MIVSDQDSSMAVWKPCLSRTSWRRRWQPTSTTSTPATTGPTTTKNRSNNNNNISFQNNLKKSNWTSKIEQGFQKMTSPLTPDRLLNSLELTSFYLVKIVDPGLSPDPETSFKSRALEQLWFLRYFYIMFQSCYCNKRRQMLVVQKHISKIEIQFPTKFQDILQMLIHMCLLKNEG